MNSAQRSMNWTYTSLCPRTRARSSSVEQTSPMTPSTSLPSMMGVLMERVSRQRSRPGQRVQMKCSRGVSMTNERRMRMTWR